MGIVFEHGAGVRLNVTLGPHPFDQRTFRLAVPEFPSRFLVGHGPTINIARLLSSEPWSSNSNQIYSVEGADAVIQSARHSPARPRILREFL
jgi:hypothetical protein